MDRPTTQGSPRNEGSAIGCAPTPRASARHSQRVDGAAGVAVSASRQMDDKGGGGGRKGIGQVHATIADLDQVVLVQPRQGRSSLVWGLLGEGPDELLNHDRVRPLDERSQVGL